MGKGTIVQACKSPLGMAVQISGNHKNSLNDPGGGSFRYILPGEWLPFLVFFTWGQHFSKMPHMTTGYSLSWDCECLAHIPAWPPDCLPHCPAAAGVVGHGPPISLSLTRSLCLSLSTHHIATHAQPIDHTQNCPHPPYISVTTHWKAYRWAESYFRNKVILSRWLEFLDVVLKIPFG